jgi:hypothetical protein
VWCSLWGMEWILKCYLDECEVQSLLEYTVVYSNRCRPTFQRCVLPPSSGQTSVLKGLLDWFIYSHCCGNLTWMTSIDLETHSLRYPHKVFSWISWMWAKLCVFLSWRSACPGVWCCATVTSSVNNLSINSLPSSEQHYNCASRTAAL